MSLKFQPINLDKRILVIHENGVCLGDLSALEDGYYYWWPDKDRRGCLDSHILRQIADKLDELNAPWDEEVRRGLEAANRDRGERPDADRLSGGGNF